MGNGICEKDPNGIDQHTPGAKLDAGKLRPNLVFTGFANALEQVVKVGTDGAAKYSDDGWKQVENGKERYLDALGRHLLAFQKGEAHDPMSGSHHLAHVAWNALAALELMSNMVVFKMTDEQYEKLNRVLDACKGCEWTPDEIARLSEFLAPDDEPAEITLTPEQAEMRLRDEQKVRVDFLLGKKIEKYADCASCAWSSGPCVGIPCDGCQSLSGRAHASSWVRR